MGFERSPSASCLEALSLSQFSNANTQFNVRAHTHVAPWRKLQMLLSVSAHLYLAEREPSRNYTALGEAGEVAKTALLSAFSRSGVSLTDTVYCSQQNQ